MLEQFADLRGSGLGKKRGGGFFEVGEGIDTPNAYYDGMASLSLSSIFLQKRLAQKFL